MRPLSPGPFRRRLAAGVTTIALVTGLLTACTGVSDRSAEADALSGGLRALPGVQSVRDLYSNDYTAGTYFTADVELEPDANSAEVDAVTSLYFSAVDRGDFEDHRTTLSLETGDDSVEFAAGSGEAVDSAGLRLSVARWFTLIGDLDGSLEWTFQGITDLRYRPDAGLGLVSAVQAVRLHAPDLQNARWTLEIGSIAVQWGGTFPDDEVTRLAAELTADNRASLVLTQVAGNGSQTLQLSVTPGQVDDPESTARTDLERIALLRRPVLYELNAGDGVRVQVLVGGCRPGASELEQRLTSEFGTC